MWVTMEYNDMRLFVYPGRWKHFPGRCKQENVAHPLKCIRLQCLYRITV